MTSPYLLILKTDFAKIEKGTEKAYKIVTELISDLAAAEAKIEELTQPLTPVAYTTRYDLNEVARGRMGRIWGEPLPYHDDLPLYSQPVRPVESLPVSRVSFDCEAPWWVTHPDGFHIQMATKARADQIAREIALGRAKRGGE